MSKNVFDEVFSKEEMDQVFKVLDLFEKKGIHALLISEHKEGLNMITDTKNMAEGLPFQKISKFIQYTAKQQNMNIH